jgi:hypothetical protein
MGTPTPNPSFLFFLSKYGGGLAKVNSHPALDLLKNVPIFEKLTVVVDYAAVRIQVRQL